MSWRSDMDEFGPDLDFWEEIDHFNGPEIEENENDN